MTRHGIGKGWKGCTLGGVFSGRQSRLHLKLFTMLGDGRLAFHLSEALHDGETVMMRLLIRGIHRRAPPRHYYYFKKPVIPVDGQAAVHMVRVRGAGT
jgi:hypothetical protein